VRRRSARRCLPSHRKALGAPLAAGRLGSRQPGKLTTEALAQPAPATQLSEMDTVTLLLLIALPFWLGLLAWLWRSEHRRQRPGDRR
jgi:hypothetical protein